MDKEGVLEEYKALRAEVGRNEKEGLRIILFLVTALLTIIGFSDESPIPLWLTTLIIQATLIVGLAQYLDSLRLRCRISKYIEVFIEPSVSELKWETLNTIFSDDRRKMETRLERLGYYFYLWVFNVFVILFLVGASVSTKLLYSYYNREQATCAFCLWFIGLSATNLSILYLTWRCVRERYLNTYEKKCLGESIQSLLKIRTCSIIASVTTPTGTANRFFFRVHLEPQLL